MATFVIHYEATNLEGDVWLKVEDALRKIALLRKISNDKGALAAEAETAHRLEKVLMERFSIRPQDIPDGSRSQATPFRLNWTYWRELVDEFDLPLSHFGGRGSVELGPNIIVYIRLAANQWWVEEKSAREWQATVRGRGIESLREYLKEHAPRGYSFVNAERARAERRAR
jgi:hypothetical protein